MRTLLLASLLLASSSACKKNKAADKDPPKAGPTVAVTATTGSATPATPTPPAPSMAKPLEATFEGKPYKFISAVIVSDGTDDRFRLSTGALGCGDEPKPADTILEFEVGLGPGGKHFSPGPLVISGSVYGDDQKFVIDSFLYAIVNLTPGEWKEGNKVKGTIRIDDADNDPAVVYKGEGSFEATVCETENDSRYQATPEAADAGPVTGTLGGEKFTAKGAIAILSHDSERDRDEISSIRLFDAPVDCDNYSEKKGLDVQIQGYGGSSGTDIFLGAPQPRRLNYRQGSTQFFLSGPAWIKFDALELKEGTEVKGSFHAEASTEKVKADAKYAGRLSGSFTAKVCR